MAGADGIPKFALWNREDQFQPLQTQGVIFNEADLNVVGGVPTSSFAAAAITPAELMADWVITSATPLALTAPSNTALNDRLSQTSHYVIGNSFTVTFTNTDLVASHTVAFPAFYNVSPNPITIPPNSKGTITIQLTGLPCIFTVTSFNITSANGVVTTVGAPLLPGATEGDLLEWDGTSWVPSSTINNSISALLNSIIPFPPPSGFPFQKLGVLSGLNVNFFNNLSPPSGITRPYVGASDSILAVSVPVPNAMNQSGIVAISEQGGGLGPNNVLANNASSNFTSTYNTARGVLSAIGTPNFLWHYVGNSNLTTAVPPIPVNPSGMDIGQQFFGTGFTVVSDGRTKKNVEKVKLDSRELRDFVLSKFNYLHESDECRKNLGFIAQDVQKFCPAAYGAPRDEKSLSNVTIMPLLAALAGYAQDLEGRVTSLESQLAKSAPVLKSVAV
jgi:hypothetical protein